jgi:transcription initiation factor IIF auxiliary subunit
MKNIKFNNFARYTGLKNGQDWYEWLVYVDESNEILDEIKSVEYLLHRSFPNPLRKRTNREKNFSLESSGWGEFTMRITVFFKNGQRIETSYYLDLSKNWNQNVFGDG